MTQKLLFPLLAVLLSACSLSSLIPAAAPRKDPGPGTRPQAAQCAQLSLTPEECANAGSHQYAVTSQATFVGASVTCQNNQSTYPLVFIFSAAGSVKVISPDGIAVNMTHIA